MVSTKKCSQGESSRAGKKKQRTTARLTPNHTIVSLNGKGLALDTGTVCTAANEMRLFLLSDSTSHTADRLHCTRQLSTEENWGSHHLSWL